MAQLADHVALEFGGWYYSNLTLPPTGTEPIAAARFAERAGEVDLDAGVWVFDRVGPARFWLRQTVLETGLHAWDAAGAVAHPSPLDAEIATEAIDQYLDNLAHHGRWWGEPHTPPVRPVGIVATDAGRSWVVRGEGDRTMGASGRGDQEPIRIAAPGVSLLLWLTGREPEDAPEILGDLSPAAEWQAGFR